MESNNCELLIKDDFKKDKLIGKKKVMPGDRAKDERSSIPANDLFKIETYNYINDIFINSLNKRFLNNSKLLKDCICLDPKHFNNIKNNIPADALVELSRLTNIDRNTLVEELQQFAIHFDRITKSLRDTFCVLNDNLQSPIDEYEPNIDLEDLYNDPSNNCKKCNNCLKCAFNIAHDIIQQSGSFNNIYFAYKFILTLPCTQVTCERTFSKLKIIKTKLRSTIC